MSTQPTEPDVITDRFGSIAGITPNDASRPRMDRRKLAIPSRGNGWVRLCNVDCRYAADILQGMADDGLILA